MESTRNVPFGCMDHVWTAQCQMKSVSYNLASYIIIGRPKLRQSFAGGKSKTQFTRKMILNR